MNPNYLGRKRSPQNNYDSHDIKREDGELNSNNDFNRRNKTRDIGKYYNNRKNNYSPHLNRRRTSHESPHRAYNNKYREENFYDRDKNRRNSRRNQSPQLSESSSYEDLKKERNVKNHKKKKYNFLVCLQKNYYRYIEQDYDSIYREIKNKVKDIIVFQHDYTVSGFDDYIMRIDAPSVISKAHTMKIVCDYLFNEMKQTYKNMTYLKISILVPSHVVGFIIGIEGKNINRIRDMSGARIEVFQHDINDKFRQIELAGTPIDISRASEKIYKIVNKYFFITPSTTTKKHRESSTERYKKRRLDEPKRRIHIKKQLRKPRSLSPKKPDDKLKLDKKRVDDKKEIEKERYNEKERFHENELNNEVKILEKSVKDHISDDSKVSINLMIPTLSLNLLAKFRNNIYIEMENQYGLTIEKKVEKLTTNDEVNILTFTGTPMQNTLAIFHLQKYILDLEKKGFN